LLAASIFAGLTATASAAPLVTAAVDDAITTVVKGDLSPLLTKARDMGAVADTVPLTHAMAVLKRAPAQQAALDKLVHDQLDRKSPLYHKWLTPADLRAYGPDAADIAKVTTWMQSHRLTVNKVSPSGMFIDFSGKASDIGGAFHTTLHNVTLPSGEAHISNMTDAAIPSALTPVLRGATLSNFFPKPTNVKISPDFTTTTKYGTFYAVAPQDFATIYNLTPLFDGANFYGARIAGAGVTLAVVEQTDILRRDWNSFRAQFGLSQALGKLVFEHPGGCTDPGYSAGDETEAAIDVEWSGAVAPDATIIEASCDGGSLGFGVENALLNLVETGTKAAALSISYGSAEVDLTFLAGWETLVEEGASEGLSIFVSSGDSGVSSTESIAYAGLGVNGLATTPYNTSVGGTDFYDSALNQNSSYWSTNNSSLLGSAKSYIPEIPWDNSCASSVIVAYLGDPSSIVSCNRSKFAATGNLAFQQQGIGGTGGQSIIYEKPEWQSAPGVPNDGVRDQPDVSFFAANGSWHHFYLVCMSDKPRGGYPCDYTNTNDLLGNGYGGTSISTPAFAGTLALVVQSYHGERQGNAAPRLYQIATSQFQQPLLASQCSATLGNKIGAGCVFNNVTTGNNAEPCYEGTPNCYVTKQSKRGLGVLANNFIGEVDAFPATPGYNLATGLGSVNIANLLYTY